VNARERDAMNDIIQARKKKESRKEEDPVSRRDLKKGKKREGEAEDKEGHLPEGDSCRPFGE